MRSIASPISSTMACSRCCTTETVIGSTSAKLRSPHHVIAGLVPAIRCGMCATSDGRDQPGHDDREASGACRTRSSPHHRRVGPQRPRVGRFPADRSCADRPDGARCGEMAWCARRRSRPTPRGCATHWHDATRIVCCAHARYAGAVIDAAPADARAGLPRQHAQVHPTGRTRMATACWPARQRSSPPAAPA